MSISWSIMIKRFVQTIINPIIRYNLISTISILYNRLSSLSKFFHKFESHFEFFCRKLDEYELKESAEKVVKATTSFPLSPPFQGYMGDSSSSLRSYSSTLISTPIPRSRDDFTDRMKMQDNEIDRLEKENIKQRQEVNFVNFSNTVKVFAQAPFLR